MNYFKWFFISLLLCLFVEFNFSQNQLGGWDPEDVENADKTIKLVLEKEPDLKKPKSKFE